MGAAILHELSACVFDRTSTVSTASAAAALPGCAETTTHLLSDAEPSYISYTTSTRRPSRDVAAAPENVAVRVRPRGGQAMPGGEPRLPAVQAKRASGALGAAA